MGQTRVKPGSNQGQTIDPLFLAELPDLIKLYDALHAKALEILTVNVDSSREQVAKVISEKKIIWRQNFDGKGRDTKLAQR
jgi:hypothetical protein